MKKSIAGLVLGLFLTIAFSAQGQDYFFKEQAPFDPSIPTPEAFLGYPIGEQHTRHDRMVAYFEKLAEVSDRAEIEVYGQSHERRKLVMLRVSSPQNLQNLDQIKSQHLRFVDAKQSPTNYDEVPVLVQLGYNVHGNEPSGGEAALLTAYILVASNNPQVLDYLNKAVMFIDPAINPDGRDRHTQWVNQYQGSPLVSDGLDAEHIEMWPRGRTNHYWFDLNRDWLLGINPESRGKLNWYHQWYPNVVTDFHEMGTNSHYFFEPMKPIGSWDPIMPRENYEDLNNLFAPYYQSALDDIGSLYYTKESFDGTYPGYGSSYPDLQGALALLFEQASSRGHLQDTDYGTISFPFTIRNQFKSSIATIKAAVENKATLRKYQQDFFKSAISERPAVGFTAYEFGDVYDQNRNKAFIDKLLLHKIRVLQKGPNRFVVPVQQPQRRMVQTVFETYTKYRDSVFYDASAWSVANFYNMKYQGVRSNPTGNELASTENLVSVTPVSRSSYAYLMDWDDYNAPAALYYMQSKGVQAAAAFKPFGSTTNAGAKTFNYGSIMIPVSKQKDLSSDEVFDIVQQAQQKFQVPIYATNTGFSTSGIDLGSNNFRKLDTPKALLLIGDGVNSYEAGEVWHLLDTRVQMPITKLQLRTFNWAPLDDYNTIVMVSGGYQQLDSAKQKQIKQWVSKGNTLITIAGASRWAINTKLVNESLTKNEKDKDSLTAREPYVDAGENRGKERVGGAIFEVDVDITHPLGFGYRDAKVPVYKNNNVFIEPSKNEYSTLAKYTDDPHIDGYISTDNYENMLKPSASLIVSRVGGGRVVMFADNPNFRGSWYGTNRLFLNALFLGNHIRIP